MANTEKIVKFWRGSRESFNILLNAKKLDYWTRYSVKEPSGTWSEYFGDNLISSQSGQLLPVIDIVSSLPDTLHNGDRYLVGHDATDVASADYYIVEVGASKTSGGWAQNTVIKPFDEKYSVRVKSRGLMTFQIVNGKLITYDEVDCGMY